MAAELPNLKSLEQFLFETPPYVQIALFGAYSVEQLYNFDGGIVRIDGHCPFCQRPSTFTVVFQHVPDGSQRARIEERFSHDAMRLECVRESSHKIHFYFRIADLTITKIGQFPSMADIANDEVSRFRKGMNSLDAQEFHRAIGLAAHGVGVGSFVYLRRVFERLIYNRFEEFKVAEGWTDDQFLNVRMEQKIALLKDHLPEFLYENRKIYSILSVGVHALDEKNCLGWFEVMKQSIVIILEDDKKNKEELDRRLAFADAIRGFDGA